MLSLGSEAGGELNSVRMGSKNRTCTVAFLLFVDRLFQSGVSALFFEQKNRHRFLEIAAK